MEQKSKALSRIDAAGDIPLAPSGQAAPASDDGGPPRQPPPAWCAMRIAATPRDRLAAGLVYAASSERRAEEVGRALRCFAQDLEVLVLEAWDCLPYDRASPSRDVMGRRMAVLARLAEPGDRPRILVAPVQALLQRIPPARAMSEAFLELACGERLDRGGLETFAHRTGYVFDDRIDEPGEIAIRGGVVDIFPAAAGGPVRLGLDDDDRIIEIKRFDPLTQRTGELVEAVRVGPASELILKSHDQSRRPGAEHRSAEIYGRMGGVLERLAGAALLFDPLAELRAAEFAAQVAEAYEGRLGLAGEIEPPLAPKSLYLSFRAFKAAITKRPRLTMDASGVALVPRFPTARNPGRDLAAFLRDALDDGLRVILTGLPHELRSVSRLVKRQLDLSPQPITDWQAALVSAPGRLISLEADIDSGFHDRGAKLLVVAAADVLGGRIAPRGAGVGNSVPLLAEPDLRVGDVVIHEDHGLGVLSALERVEAGGVERDALRISYHGGADLLAPIEDFGRIWRYGAEREAVTLDQLGAQSWQRRRAEISAEIDRTAERLVELARDRDQEAGAVIRAPKALYNRLAARFPYPETADQAAAIEAVLEDLASGRVMNRLVCGDVGFGKTEVALRAAAAVALCGKQVAIVAPTTVLARQHYESFMRRFAGSGLPVGRLSRLVATKEASQVKAGLASGEVKIVVGTQALASADIAFKDLGLVIVDEEQRFGAGLKAQLRELAPRAHRLTLTATPIPRTLQLALVGVEDVSVIATPPARRRPIRTFVAPYDRATIAAALRREHRRGGQSFVVSPRIGDLQVLEDELRRLVPELSVQIAHGELAADELDEVMVGFASGEGDILLATNIIESGLDVPRANTMLIMRADLFGLAQLHQLRGRVGRGRAQGVAYLFHEAGADLPDATRSRLSTLEAFDRLGSGLAISARDLEIRGAGELLGEEQAGHLKLIGTSLYQRLLSRAVRLAKGETCGVDWTPQLNIGLSGSIPETYVPDATLRINLYARLRRLGTADEVDAFAEELEDRFGPLDGEVEKLIQLTRLQALAIEAGVQRIDAGPKAIAFSPAPGFDAAEMACRAGLQLSGERIVWKGRGGSKAFLTQRVLQVLEALQPG